LLNENSAVFRLEELEHVMCLLIFDCTALWKLWVLFLEGPRCFLWYWSWRKSWHLPWWKNLYQRA